MKGAPSTSGARSCRDPALNALARIVKGERRPSPGTLPGAFVRPWAIGTVEVISLMRASVSILLLAFTFGCGGATARTSARVSQAHLAGNRITLDDHINFETDSAVIAAESDALIADIAMVLTSHSEIATVHVVGHTDSTGDDAHNLELSAARAEAVAASLRENGVTQTIDARGAGETEPLCTDDTDECHATNRRVELMVEAN